MQSSRRKASLGSQGRQIGRFFTDLEGEHFHSRERRNKLTEAVLADMRAAGIPGASFHTLRHTAAAWMVQAGRSLYEGQRILGHSTPVMTQRYAHREPKHLRAAVESLDASIRGVDTPVDTDASGAARTPATATGSAMLSATSEQVGR